jgi:EAL domain-containing protein (putative c-di-GMP-specific phosphodiesterase class I)
MRTLFTKMDYVIAEAKLFSNKEYYFVEDINNYRTKEEWINIINSSLKEDHFKLLYRDIIGIDLKAVLHKTISFELEYKENNISYKDFIASILELNKLDEVYLHIIKKVLESNENINENISIQLPTLFIEDLNNYSKIKELFENNRNTKIQNIIFEIEEEAFRKNLANILIYIELFKEYNFGFAVFNFIANSDDYTYLIDLKPLYIKASKYFLLESKQSLNVLKILTQSLDIKLIATSVVETSDLSLLSDVGINAICGPIMENLPK